MAGIHRPTPPRKLLDQRPLRILISGSTGYIGSELTRQLAEDGHTVLRLVRRTPRAPDEHAWSPDARTIDPALVDSVDAVINLSGASTGRIPWTRGYRRTLRESRIGTTETLVRAMGTAATPPSVFLSASAVGFYGDQPGVRLTEQSAKGGGFLADLTADWEAAAREAPAGTRVVSLRTGIVVGRGGAFTPLNLLARFGLGARMGGGGQHWPWISLHDETAAIRHLLTSRVSGPVNLAGPTPATADRVTRSLARAMKRWHPFVIPEVAIRLGLGEAGTTLLLTSAKVAPAKLLADGFRFRHDTVEQAIAAMIATKRD